MYIIGVTVVLNAVIWRLYRTFMGTQGDKLYSRILRKRVSFHNMFHLLGQTPTGRKHFIWTASLQNYTYLIRI